MKWPKEWIDAVADDYMRQGRPGYNSKKIRTQIIAVLNALHKVGALKDPPKPREWIICSCGCVVPSARQIGDICGRCGSYQLIRVREVLEDK